MPPEKEVPTPEVEVDETPEGETEVEVEEEETEVEGEEEEAEEEEEESEEDRKQAKNLYKLLKNPDTAKQVIRSLAEQNGLLKVDTPSEVKKTKKALAELVEEGLGAEFKFLGPQLTRVLDAVLNQEREERTTQISSLESQQVERDVENALSKLARETKGESKKIENKMLDLMSKYLPAPGMPVEEYIRGIYAQASAGRTAKTAAAQVTDRIKRNAKDAPSRLQSAPGVSNAPKVLGKMNLEDSVNAALASINSGKRK